ncbi:MAG: hypothetical protein GYA33_11630 [Thermogutta sp.]|nr:hypothetical protein [Thermogutta sp.]
MKNRFIWGLGIGLMLPFLAGCPRAGNPTGQGDQASAGSAAPEEAPEAGPQAAREEPGSVRAAKKEWQPGVHRLGAGPFPGTSSVVVVHQRPLLFTRELSQGAEGGGSAEGLIAKLSSILEAGGTDLTRLVRLNVYGASLEDVEAFLSQLPKLLPEGCPPVVTAVVMPHPDPLEKLAIDAIAAVEGEAAAVTVKSVPPRPAHVGPADYSLAPAGNLVFLSGRPEKGETAEAAQASIKGQLALAAELGCGPADVVQLRVFLAKIKDTPTVFDAIRSAFSDRPVPPVSFAFWIASAPVEIEMIACRPKAADNDGEGTGPIRFYNPPDVKPSPNFSRAAVVNSPTLIFTAGFLAREDGDGTRQTRDVFSQLTEALGSAGSDLRHGAKAHYFVSDDDAAKAVDVLRKEYLDPARPPAASKAKVHGLGRPGRSVCIDWISVPGDS